MVLCFGQSDSVSTTFPTLLLQQLLVEDLPDHNFPEIWHMILERERERINSKSNSAIIIHMYMRVIVGV